MKIAFHTLGCKVNQYETEALREQFQNLGHQIVGEDEFADVYVINTCTVTGLADRKSRQYIRRMKKTNPESIIAVTGCYAQVSPEEVSAIQEVDVVCGTNEKSNLAQYLEEYRSNIQKQKICHVRRYEDITEYEDSGIITSATESRTRAYIKIQEGCNRFCAYCIIPYARGRVRSRALSSIVDEARGLIENGIKEIILTGINTALYGFEEGFETGVTGISGVEAAIAALDSLPGDFRIRLSSLEPTVVNEEYVGRLLKYKKLCPHLHLSVQSGSDSVLKMMNRRYSRADYLAIVEALKEFDPYYGITTDIIAGFPGESQMDFDESLSIIEEVGFCKVHVFKYSKRKGTKAAELKEQVNSGIKSRRSELLIQAGEKSSAEFFNRNAGKTRTVLFEEYDEKTGCLEGYTDNYIRVFVPMSRQEAWECPWETNFLTVQLISPYLEGMKGRIL